MTARIYLRISRPDEAQILENQRMAAIGHAAAEGFEEPAIYDETASGGDADRPGLGKLLKDVRRGDVVIFSSISRMSRGGIGASLEILRQLERAGAGWHFIETPMLNFDSNAPQLVKEILFAVLAAIAEDYRRQISRSTKAAYDRRKAAADASGVKVHWGVPIGTKPRKCRFCGLGGQAKVHSSRHHKFEKGTPGPGCRHCGASPKAMVHVSGHHIFNPLPRSIGGEGPSQENAPKVSRDDS